MTAFAWPPGLGPKSVAFNRRGMTISGPVSLSGRSMVAQYDAGYWIARLSGVNAAGPTNVLAHRRLSALMEGGAHQVFVPVFDRANAPWPVAGVYESLKTYSGGETFSGGEKYSASVIIAAMAAAAARATRITPTVTTASTIRGGEFFEIAATGRLHSIKSVDVAAGTWDIWPPLREAVLVSTELNFDDPKCLMRLQNESDGDLDLTMGRYGFPDLEFVEVIE